MASRLSVASWKRLALPVLVVGVVLQLLVLTPMGIKVNGNQNWLQLGPLRMQPSEIIKVGLVLAGGLVLSAKRKNLHSLSHVVVPFLVPVAAVSIGVVVLGHDLGTVLILGAIVAGVLFAAGVPLRWFAFAGIPFVAMAVAFVVTSPNRLGRFDVWLGRDTDEWGAARQPIHGRYALADGGWFGLGLGASREKWGLLSEPHNDFIFAIIGEELGLPGTVAVLLLFAGLTLACYRLVTRTDDFFVRVATAGIMTWIVVQALINIGAVINLLPVIGVPLPLVSSGGSSLVTTMFGLGILLSFARSEPGCAAGAVRPAVRAAPVPRGAAPRGPCPQGPTVTGRGPASVLLAGGGTAGHVSPLLALADCLRRRDPDVRITALGTAAGLEARLVPERGYELLEVPRVPFPRRPSADVLRLPGNLRRAVSAAGQAVDSTGADVVVGFGGYVSTPRTSPRAAAASPSSSTSRTPGPGSPTGWARGSPRRWQSPSPGRACRTPR